jgi:hypothetical protein
MRNYRGSEHLELRHRKGHHMAWRYRFVLLSAAALISASALTGSGLLAQTNTQNQQNQQKKPLPPAKPVTPAVAPKIVAPTVAPKIVAPAAAPKFIAPTATPNAVGPGPGPKFVTPTNPNFAPRSSGQRAVGPNGNAARAVAIRGANNTTIGGRMYSVRRGSYRAYSGGYWRTFVGVGTLGAIMYGGYRYYPYAYIDAPPDLCDGETEDGCQLQWQQVQTMEGPVDFQCVAYCPWQ